METEIFIKNVDEALNLKRDQRVKFLCEKCKKEVTIRAGVFINSKTPKKTLLCRKHRQIENCELLGIDYEQRKNERMQKGFETQRKRYGGIGAQNKENLEKGRKTKKERYGNENYNNTKKFKETLSKRTQDERDLITEKRKQTCKDKYGKDFVMQVPEIKKTLMMNNLKKYGFTNPSKSLKVQEKRKQTCLEKYGVPSFTCTTDFKNYMHTWGLEHFKPFHKKYLQIRGVPFDSSWELIFYLAMKLKGNHVKRSTKKLPYFVGEKMHYYYPDFEVNGDLWEVKGDQFFDKEGNLINPFSKSIEEQEKNLAKQNCMIQNHVNLVKGSDIKIFKAELDNVFLEKFLQENAYIFKEIEYYCFIFDFFKVGFQYVEELGKVYWRNGNLCIEKW